ncbi:hypothetical protein [Streptomyces sp. NPDC088812]|uniref:hypothetical protein n=1 Tax=Streptomyces sp. NPDC088812 TaxID=3365905 RepID=UPI003816CAC1
MARKPKRNTAGFDVDQQGAVPLPVAEGEIVDTGHARRLLGHGRLREQAQQPRPARLQPQPLPGTATRFDRNRMLPLLQSEAGAAVPLAEQATCSTNVRIGHRPRSQKNGRTRNRTVRFRPFTGSPARSPATASTASPSAASVSPT